MLPTITIDGRAVNDPELRFTGSGKAVTNFRVAASESKKTDTGWEDGDRLFVNVAVWDQAGEQVAEMVRKGDKVVVVGRLYQREYETTSGEKRTSLEVKFATVAKVVDAPKAQRVGATQGAPAQRTDDPWATPAGDDEPPF